MYDNYHMCMNTKHWPYSCLYGENFQVYAHVAKYKKGQKVQMGHI